MFPAWRDVQHVTLEPILGGITNDLLMVTPAVDAAASEVGAEAVAAVASGVRALKPVLVRVFGGGTERFLDRAREARAVLELNQQVRSGWYFSRG